MDRRPRSRLASASSLTTARNSLSCPIGVPIVDKTRATATQCEIAESLCADVTHEASFRSLRLPEPTTRLPETSEILLSPVTYPSHLVVQLARKLPTQCLNRLHGPIRLRFPSTD